MKIGLVRHFKVDSERSRKDINWEEYKNIMSEYDNLDVIKSDVDLRAIEWNKCYSSTLSRARITAETIYEGEIIELDSLVEVDYKVVKEVEGMKPMSVWSIYSMVSWAQERETVNEVRSETLNRLNKFLDALEKEVQEDDNVLIVCHGMLMSVFQDVLRERGFSGEDIIFPKNGVVYLYEN